MKRNHNTKILWLFLSLVCFLYILYLILYRKPSSNQIELFTNKDIQYSNWWSSDPQKYTNLFQYMFENSSYPHIKIYSVFPTVTMDKKKSEGADTLVVQFSGESIYGNPDNFDINFIPTDNLQPDASTTFSASSRSASELCSYTERSNVIVFPYALFHMLMMKMDMQLFLVPRTLPNTRPEQFCLFSVSNGAAVERKEFFLELSKYKKVDSCGKFMNNMDMGCPNDHESSEYYDFIAKYKFMICFENTSLPNYLTEKIVNAYSSGTIPIYWGCPNLGDYVNMDSILYLPPKYTIEDRNQLIQKIIYLDTNPDAYRAMYEQSFFKNGKLPDEFNIEKIKEKISKIK